MGSVWPPFVIFDRVRTSYKGRSALQDNIQVVLIFATGLKITEAVAQNLQKFRVRVSRSHRTHRSSGYG